jgi:hypothetical protein
MQAVTCVQRGHLAGSSNAPALQVGASFTAKSRPGIAQQPKQSQPFGVTCRQRFTQACDC